MTRFPVAAVSAVSVLAAAAAAVPPEGDRVLACRADALTSAQRARHAASTEKLLKNASRRELPGGYELSVPPKAFTPAELAEWVADESRCCPFLDFQASLPANGTMTLRLEGGPEVKAFLRAELGL